MCHCVCGMEVKLYLSPYTQDLCPPCSHGGLGGHGGYNSCDGGGNEIEHACGIYQIRIQYG